ncbi:MAG: DTW domain-containing protein [Gammaproteobacteria bacterium]|nr:DTW domain-containing protein [Gammaproteobacteria bacterium]
MPAKAKRPSCSHCSRPLQQCYCHTITQVENRWPIHILQHAQEERHPLGTARIAALSLGQCQIYPENSIESFVGPGGDIDRPLLVYPGTDANDIDDIEKGTPRPLLFIDASWRKSRRMFYDYPFLNELERVSFTPQQASRYRIRKSPQQNYLSTLESIVFVLSTLEGESEQYLPLLKSMDYLIETQIACMGEETFRRNYSDQKDN